MSPALKQTKALSSTLRRKAHASTTPQSNKKRKKTSQSPRIDSESVADVPSFNANVVPSSHKPKPGEVLKTFDEVAEDQSLVSQAEGFYKQASKICVDNGHDWDALNRYKTAVCKLPRRISRVCAS